MSHKYRKDLIAGAVGIGLILLFIFTTNPATLPVPLLLLLPIMVLVTGLIIIRLVLRVFTHLSEPKIKGLGIVLAVGPTLLVILGSLGQLSIQDIALALMLVAGFAWYLKRVQGLGTAV